MDGIVFSWFWSLCNFILRLYKRLNIYGSAWTASVFARSFKFCRIILLLRTTSKLYQFISALGRPWPNSMVSAVSRCNTKHWILSVIDYPIYNHYTIVTNLHAHQQGHAPGLAFGAWMYKRSKYKSLGNPCNFFTVFNFHGHLKKQPFLNLLHDAQCSFTYLYQFEWPFSHFWGLGKV